MVPGPAVETSSWLFLETGTFPVVKVTSNFFQLAPTPETSAVAKTVAPGLALTRETVSGPVNPLAARA